MGGVFVVVFYIGLMLFAVIYLVGTTFKGINIIEVFEGNLIKHGFRINKRINAYDLGLKNGYKHWWIVGIWLDYSQRLIALRLNKESREPIIISFDRIQSVEIIIDGDIKTSGIGIAYGPFIFGSANSKEIIKELQVRIVTSDNYKGTQHYVLILYDSSSFGFAKPHPDYKVLENCARRIYDEISYILRN